MTNPTHFKIFFELVQDDDGYPPVASESVWATAQTNDNYVLDNIPFFVRAATLGDTVRAAERDGNLWFVERVGRSANSLLRVVLFEPERVEELREELSKRGCSTEWNAVHRLVAVNVPKEAPLHVVQEYLANEMKNGWLEYEEPILRQ